MGEVTMELCKRIKNCRKLFYVLLLTATTAQPAVMEEKPIIRGRGLCQFVLSGYPLSAQHEGEINKIVAQELVQHENLFQFKAGTNFHVRIRLFWRYEDYEQFALTNRQIDGVSLNTGSLTNVAGYYTTTGREVVTWRQNPPSYLANNILHEASHAIMFGQFRHIPTWLSEGCATYFAFPRFVQDVDDVNALAYRWAKLNLWERDGKLPNLKSFVNLSDAQWHRLKLDQAYTVSWSICQFLLASPQNRQVLRRFLEQLQQADRHTTDCAALLDKEYPGGLKRLEFNWHNWIAETSPKVLGPSMEKILERLRETKE
jgi:hypothetical protein